MSKNLRKGAPKPDPSEIYEDVYTRLTEIMDRAPTFPGADLAVLDAAITAVAHFAADSLPTRDAAPGVLKYVQLFAERMRETLVADEADDADDADAGDDPLSGAGDRDDLP